MNDANVCRMTLEASPSPADEAQFIRKVFRYLWGGDQPDLWQQYELIPNKEDRVNMFGNLVEDQLNTNGPTRHWKMYMEAFKALHQRRFKKGKILWQPGQIWHKGHYLPIF